MYLFASEAVSAGHPDKCADIIADSIVDTLLQLDPDSKVATEVFISGKHIIIGGGSQSSKDYTKVDRTALYAARWLAKHIVAAGLAKKALIQLSYIIAEPRPSSVTVDTQYMGLTELKDEELSQIIADKFPLTPRWITEKFGLDRPSDESFLYADIAAKGQIGYAEYPWEELDELAWFKKEFLC